MRPIVTQHTSSKRGTERFVGREPGRRLPRGKSHPTGALAGEPLAVLVRAHAPFSLVQRGRAAPPESAPRPYR